MAPSAVTKDLKRKRSRAQDDDEAASASTTTAARPYKQRVLVLSSRGISQRQRHLMSDLTAMLPHAKKDAKLDTKHQLALVNELCDLSNCNNALFFEARRKHNDLYLWAAKAPNGPSIRFHVLNIHTMDEMKMTGNCLKGSRPLVVFDQQFDAPDAQPQWKIMKEMLTHIFAVPKTARRAKPFVDHVINFSIVDGKIWFRQYQILDNPSADPTLPSTSSTVSTTKATKAAAANGPKMSLNEIGPRFVLTPVKIFEGSFNGACLYENKEFVPSQQAYLGQKLVRASKYRGRKDQEEQRRTRESDLLESRPEKPLETRSVFA
ncbi:BZ3500_MvSof-1268-A1-R1_Chr9g10392 [Microbotryum saponariae]|uniref:BZ3500_MvSof-1268-A1-R1_Chr9g10392 protein n=1 Tax=Microbotryum saponariae TaxID=289078 RepID=A0A2X0N474_9BASI|nr:BZ3501_MvSof-1269-A2-R1_Chr9g10142 [Microbotryum saponariae]SDA00016.1 BZ3500_MvSof-1268-A1-R1_Chr9g10392 [Microbotryum saponariae]